MYNGKLLDIYGYLKQIYVCVCIYIILCSHEKEERPAIYNDIGGT